MRISKNLRIKKTSEDSIKTSIQKFGFINRVDNVGAKWIRSDEGLTLETSAFRISVQWPIHIINSVDKTKFLYTTSPLMQHHSFFRNYPLHSIKTRSTPASISFIGQVIKHTTVKWSIIKVMFYWDQPFQPQPVKVETVEVSQ